MHCAAQRWQDVAMDGLPRHIIEFLLILWLLFVDVQLEAVFLVDHNRRLCNSIDTLEMAYDYCSILRLLLQSSFILEPFVQKLLQSF